jgi:diaminopimelate epimerase
MDIKAFKMDGLGNDFVIIDQRNINIDLSKDQIIKICDRNYIGCDQLILIKKNRKIDADLEFYNSDGSVSGACGNGTRCVASLLAKENNKKEIILWTSEGILRSKILDNNIVETEIGFSKTNWDEIPLSQNLNTRNLNIKIVDKNNKEYIGGTAVNVGNPHVVFFVDDIENYDLKIIGPKIENHKYFPEKCNVTLAKVINNNLIKVKVWERGAGLTKACGTAACATVLAGNINELVEKKVDIEFALGKLSIFIDDNNSIHMKGPVSDIKNIEIKL